MTVFVGPSNTGKSYMAMLIYASIKTLSSAERNNIHWQMQIPSSHTKEIILACIQSKEQEAYQAIEAYFKAWSHLISTEWNNEVQRCFSENGDEMIEEATVKISNSNPSLHLEIDLTIHEESKISKSILRSIYQNLKEEIERNKKILHLIDAPEHDDDIDDLDVDIESYRIISKLNDIISCAFLNVLYDQGDYQESNIPKGIPRSIRRRTADLKNVHYLPAIRGGIIQSYRTLVSSMINLAPWAGIRPSPPIPLFNGVLADFMRELISIDKKTTSRRRDIQMRRRSIKNVAEAIEKKILSGNIEIILQAGTGHPDLQYSFTSNGVIRKLSLMSASSTISELASVVLFINNYLYPGSYFILEEPEAHLHPKAQREIAVMLAKLVKAGVNVLITTHSDIVCDQIGNFIYAEKSSDSKVENIQEESCATYIFNKSKRSNHGKTKVEPVPFDMEGGYATKDHLDVHSDLYNETVKLMEKQPDDND